MAAVLSACQGNHQFSSDLQAPARSNSGTVEVTALPVLGSTSPTLSHNAVLQGDGRMRLDISVEEAVDLTSLAVALDYDPAAWHFADGTATELLNGDKEHELLQLAQEVRPGHCELGQALARLDGADGFSGSGVVAQVWLAPGPARAASDARPLLPRPTEISYDAAAGELRWAYELAGDYDQNGETNAADILPLAKHFGESIDGVFDYVTIQAVIDGDRNGAIGLGDLTVIGKNLGKKLDGYRVYASQYGEGYPKDDMQQAVFAEGFTVGSVTDPYCFYPEKYMFFTAGPAQDAKGAGYEYSQHSLDMDAFTPQQRMAGRIWLTAPYTRAARVEGEWVRWTSGSEASFPSNPVGRGIPQSAFDFPEDYYFGFASETDSGLTGNAYGYFSWYEVLQGDIDANGDVNIVDLSAGSIVSNLTSWSRSIDTDRNGIVTWADLRAVPKCANAHVYGYQLFRVDSEAQLPAEDSFTETNPPMPEAVIYGPNDPRFRTYQYPPMWAATIPDRTPGWYYVRPIVDPNDGELGPPSTAWELKP